MPGLEFKRVGMEEIELLIKSRIDYCMWDNPQCSKEEFELFRESVIKWTQKNSSTGNFIGYLGYIENILVSFAGVLMYDLPPILKKHNRKQGIVLSFFTYPEYRSQGIGDKMMKFIINDAKKLNIENLVLHATSMGEPLYIKNGFKEPSLRYMELNIE